jgi:hypothetical protein
MLVRSIEHVAVYSRVVSGGSRLLVHKVVIAVQSVVRQRGVGVASRLAGVTGAVLAGGRVGANRAGVIGSVSSKKG